MEVIIIPVSPLFHSIDYWGDSIQKSIPLTYAWTGTKAFPTTEKWQKITYYNEAELCSYFFFCPKKLSVSRGSKICGSYILYNV